ncbi:hypothetical protein D3C71_1472930 [compost metagenome]
MCGQPTKRLNLLAHLLKTFLKPNRRHNFRSLAQGGQGYMSERLKDTFAVTPQRQFPCAWKLHPSRPDLTRKDAQRLAVLKHHAYHLIVSGNQELSLTIRKPECLAHSLLALVGRDSESAGNRSDSTNGLHPARESSAFDTAQFRPSAHCNCGCQRYDRYPHNLRPGRTTHDHLPIQVGESYRIAHPRLTSRVGGLVPEIHESVKAP